MWSDLAITKKLHLAILGLPQIYWLEWDSGLSSKIQWTNTQPFQYTPNLSKILGFLSIESTWVAVNIH